MARLALYMEDPQGDEPEIPQDDLDNAIAAELERVDLSPEEYLDVRGLMGNAQTEDRTMNMLRYALADALRTKSPAALMALAWEVVACARICGEERAREVIGEEEA